MIKFDATAEEYETITHICDRVGWIGRGKFDLAMDIAATHRNGCELDLDKLLNFPEFDFYHDIQGIREHIDRKTGKLRDFFLPRCSLGDKQKEARKDDRKTKVDRQRDTQDTQGKG